MLKKRDAAELSINVIILVVIGLIILVVIIAIFTKQSSNASRAFGECTTQGGECQSEDGNCNGPKIPDICPTKEKPVCCIPVET